MRIYKLKHVCLWLGMFPLLLAAEPMTVTIHDYIGANREEELVHYTLDFPRGKMKGRARPEISEDSVLWNPRELVSRVNKAD